MAHAGSCRCARVAVETNAEPFRRAYCHCRDCRKQTGAPVMAFVGFMDDELTWFGTPKSYRFGGVERLFCGDCGSQIGYRDERLGGRIYLALGFMDHPEAHPPTFHAFSKRQMPFVVMDDHLPRFDDFPPER
ncbi:GFA family protein [Rhizobium sp. EC-SD404]|uniref:GFA family protein n=1 Tax=Rhizobium sp. EC-SD404 TaxID=2038389 RepID=UPI0012546EB0|nr:GFA family protein [Rhizobium sp. EC-SD404]VVS98307.1 Aldehyde-activating protein [Rhizobium sp. EC-SD404]